MMDPMGSLIAELRTAGIASGRVYGGEAPAGVAKAPGSYQRFVVLVRLAAVRMHRAPLVEVRIGARVYGATYQDAAALYGELSDAVDNLGPRVGTSSTAIYQSLDEGSQEATLDPGTKQPYEEGVLALWVGADALA